MFNHIDPLFTKFENAMNKKFMEYLGITPQSIGINDEKMSILFESGESVKENICFYAGKLDLQFINGITFPEAIRHISFEDNLGCISDEFTIEADVTDKMELDNIKVYENGVDITDGIDEEMMLDIISVIMNKIIP